MAEANNPPSTAGSPVYSRKNPYFAELIRHERLMQAGSEKDTRHFVLSLGNSGLSYTPGDSLAVFARNSPELVDELIRLLGFDREAVVSSAHGERKPLRKALFEDYILNRANRKI